MAKRSTENTKEIKNEEVVNIEKTIVDDTEQEKYPDYNSPEWRKSVIENCKKRTLNYLYHIWEMTNSYKQENNESIDDIINALSSDIFEEIEFLQGYCKEK